MTNAELFKPYGLITQQVVFPRYSIICSPLQHSHNNSLNVIASSHRLIPCRRRGSPCKHSIWKENKLFIRFSKMSKEGNINVMGHFIHQYSISQFHRDVKWKIPLSLRRCVICILIEKSNLLPSPRTTFSLFIFSTLLKREDRKRCCILKGVLRSFEVGCGREEGKMPMKATDLVTQFQPLFITSFIYRYRL